MLPDGLESDGDTFEVVDCAPGAPPAPRAPAPALVDRAQPARGAGQARLDRRRPLRRARHPRGELRARRRDPRPHPRRARAPCSDRVDVRRPPRSDHARRRHDRERHLDGRCSPTSSVRPSCARGWATTRPTCSSAPSTAAVAAAVDDAPGRARQGTRRRPHGGVSRCGRRDRGSGRDPAGGHPARAIVLRVGISAGDARAEGDDLFGTPVVEAARLCSAAEGGQILVAALVRLLAGTRGGHEFEPVGPLTLKGLSEPVEACVVRWGRSRRVRLDPARRFPPRSARSSSSRSWAATSRSSSSPQLWRKASTDVPRAGRAHRRRARHRQDTARRAARSPGAPRRRDRAARSVRGGARRSVPTPRRGAALHDRSRRSPTRLAARARSLPRRARPPAARDRCTRVPTSSRRRVPIPRPSAIGSSTPWSSGSPR